MRLFSVLEILGSDNAYARKFFVVFELLQNGAIFDDDTTLTR